MADDKITLRSFFLGQPEKARKALANLKNGNQYKDVELKVASISSIAWNMIATQIGEAFEELLEVNILDIVLRAWAKYRLIWQCLDTKIYPSEQTIQLLEHTIQSIHRPYIEILADDNIICRIDFEINVKLTLQGFVIKIKDGRISEIRSGNCQGEGNVKCGRVTLVEVKTANINMLGVINPERDSRLFQEHDVSEILEEAAMGRYDRSQRDEPLLENPPKASQKPMAAFLYDQFRDWRAKHPKEWTVLLIILIILLLMLGSQ